MRKAFCINLLGVLLLASTAGAHASFLFHATLTTDQETAGVPAQTPLTGGSAFFLLNDAKTRLTYDVLLFGLDMRGVNPSTGIVTNGGPGQPPIPGDANPNDNVTRMHIHSQFFGVAGPIVFGMIDLPANLGTINDVNPDDLVVDIANLHVVGAWDLTEGAGVQNLSTQLDNLFAGGLYLNVHTTDFPGGEIRGQIFRVPEAGSLALLGIGTLGLVAPALRRRRRN